jgi:hypothetical protein
MMEVPAGQICEATCGDTRENMQPCNNVAEVCYMLKLPCCEELHRYYFCKSCAPHFCDLKVSVQ